MRAPHTDRHGCSLRSIVHIFSHHEPRLKNVSLSFLTAKRGSKRAEGLVVIVGGGVDVSKTLV